MDRFLIAPYDGGLQTDVKPFVIPDNAFAELNNAYVFRGRVRKRFGSRMMGNSQLNTRLRIALTLVGGTTYSLPAGATQFAVGQMVSIGTDIFTVINVGGAAIPLLSTSAVTATLNDTVNPNQITFSAVAATPFWYPSLPVMGLRSYEQADISFEPVFAFDQRYAYQFAGGFWSRS